MLLRIFTHIRIFIPWPTKHSPDRCNKSFIGSFSLPSNEYISNISNLYNLDINFSLASQKICEHLFSDPKLDNILSYFWLRTWIIYFFFSYVEIVYSLRRQEYVGIYCKLILYWIESTWARILFTAQYRMVIHNHIINNRRRSASKTA